MGGRRHREEGPHGKACGTRGPGAPPQVRCCHVNPRFRRRTFSRGGVPDSSAVRPFPLARLGLRAREREPLRGAGWRVHCVRPGVTQLGTTSQIRNAWYTGKLC
ncbi:DUF6355 family natural product biosynthesis protein [Streptomyces sp. NPDC051555]|uniref:DUF6355 family natural product biosynthesis protein n=1 Tax=Streptomyces sp. NPDC051555 TaxID=3365657 RepID=UPI0037B17EA1